MEEAKFGRQLRKQSLAHDVFDASADANMINWHSDLWAFSNEGDCFTREAMQCARCGPACSHHQQESNASEDALLSWSHHRGTCGLKDPLACEAATRLANDDTCVGAYVTFSMSFTSESVRDISQPMPKDTPKKNRKRQACVSEDEDGTPPKIKTRQRALVAGMVGSCHMKKEALAASASGERDGRSHCSRQTRGAGKKRAAADLISDDDTDTHPAKIKGAPMTVVVDSPPVNRNSIGVATGKSCDQRQPHGCPAPGASRKRAVIVSDSEDELPAASLKNASGAGAPVRRGSGFEDRIGLLVLPCYLARFACGKVVEVRTQRPPYSVGKRILEKGTQVHLLESTGPPSKRDKPMGFWKEAYVAIFDGCEGPIDKATFDADRGAHKVTNAELRSYLKGKKPAKGQCVHILPEQRANVYFWRFSNVRQLPPKYLRADSRVTFISYATSELVDLATAEAQAHRRSYESDGSVYSALVASRFMRHLALTKAAVILHQECAQGCMGGSRKSVRPPCCTWVVVFL